MVTLTKYSALSGGEVYNRNVLWIEQLSSETKPTGTFIEYDSNGKEVARMYIPNGSVLSEIDTGKTYKYDEENSTWYEFAVGGGGGNSYTKAETDALLADKADLDSDGLVPTSQIPPEVFERMKVVQDDTARFALTTDDVQNGDVVYVNDDEVMYYVYDDTKLNVEAGYKPFAAGTAAKAIADKNGNDITTTYLKSEEYNAGKTVPQGSSVTIDGTTYTVGQGAEIFNLYNSNKSVGDYSHAEGAGTKAVGNYSHAEGTSTKASGETSHAEGASTTASGSTSHAEGSSTTASGSCSHAEGIGTTSSNTYAHAEGGGTTASGSCSHAEGGSTTASGNSSHAEGGNTIASGACSHAEGGYTKASSDYQHVEGKYNVEDSNDKFAHIIGNGTANNARSNAFAVDWDGKIYTHNSNTGFDIQSNYIEFPNGQRLYNSTTAPTGNIPDGSVGVGW